MIYPMDKCNECSLVSCWLVLRTEADTTPTALNGDRSGEANGTEQDKAIYNAHTDAANSSRREPGAKPKMIPQKIPGSGKIKINLDSSR